MANYGVQSTVENDVFYSVKLTGVPRDATENDVRQFFNECAPTEVVLCEGGNVFVQFNNDQEFGKACAKDGHQLRWTKVGVLALNKADYATGISGAASGEPNKGETNKNEDDQYNVIRLRGLPYSATAADVMNFLKDVAIDKGEKGIHFSSGSYGRSTGEVFVEVCSPEDVNIAMKYDREHMGGRYIEIFRSSRAQLEWECRGAEKSGGSGGVVRLRGLPYGCSADDIRDFLKGIAICENGITIQYDENGRETGEAFIEVESDKDVERALDRHKKSVGHRYIEVFRTTKGDIKPVANRWATYSRPSPYSTRGRGYDGQRGDRYGGRGRGGMVHGSSNYSSSYGGGYEQYGQYEDPYYQGGRGGGGGGMVSYPPIRSSDTVPQYSGGGGGGSKHVIRMRGLPFSVTIRDIQNFFAPLIPINVVIERDSSGRLSGEGEVSFGSHDDALTAMSKDRTHIGSRYIELFLHSKPTYEQAPPPPSQSYDNNWTNDSSYSSYSTSNDPRTHSQTRPQQQHYSQPSYQQQQQQAAPVYGQQQQQYGGSSSSQGYHPQSQGSHGYSQQHYGMQQQQQQPPPQPSHHNTGGGGYGYGAQHQQPPPATGGGPSGGGGGGAWY